MAKGADDKKRAAAEAALVYVQAGAVLGVGTGSTVNHFIDLLPTVRDRITATASSSVASTERLVAHGFTVIPLEDVDTIPVYVDGADEVTDNLEMIKGGGGALTREKIVAAVSETFVCITDDSKCVDVLGTFPLPVEVIPMAQRHVARQLEALGGRPVLRDFITDNGNIILDVHGLRIARPAEFETQLDAIVGIVTNGLFAKRGADVLIVADDERVETITR